MIRWALRRALLWFGLTLGCASVVTGDHSLPGLARSVKASPESGVAQSAPGEPPLAPTVNALVYPIGARGHIFLDALVNGVPVRFLVDTGASLVTLSPADARVVGFGPHQLAFDQRASTANGSARMASLKLREIRLGRLSVDDIPAAVIDNLKFSLLGMSFLNRLQSYEVRNGKLTITW